MNTRKLLIAGFTASLFAMGAVSAMAQAQEGQAVPNTDRTTGQVIDDSVLTGKVKSALIADSRTKAYQIHVTTKEGVVHLNGVVDSTAAKMAATEVAQSIEGVRAVDNELSAKS
jgi:osmotically-inducible protein OsmY